MSCKRCSISFENKWVQCFDEQEIKMYMKKNGMVKLVYGEIVENTNFNFCPYCGEKLGATLNLNPSANGPGEMATAQALKQTVPDEPTELQKAIRKAIDESIFDISNLGKNFMQGGTTK